MFFKKPKKDLTSGSIFWPIILLSIPLVFSNILNTAYHIIDTFWVGKLGAEAVAATTMSWPIIFIVTSVGLGLSIAGTVLVGQYTGKKEHKEADFIATQTIVAMGIAGIVLGILGFFTAEYIIKFLGVSAEVIPLATSYLQIAFIGLAFFYMFLGFQSLMRGAGNVSLPLLVVFINVALNFFLDPIFIFGFEPLGIPAYGVMGAAIVTMITQASATIVGLLIMISGKAPITLRMDCLKPCLPVIKRLIKIGLPSSIEFFSRAGSTIIMTGLVAVFGTMALASYGLGMQFTNFAVLPAIGFSLATTTLVSQNIGAKKFSRVNKTINYSMIFSFTFLTLAGILLFIFANDLARIFIPSELEVIELTSNFIRIFSLTIGFTGIQTIIVGALRGAGNTKLGMKLSIAVLGLTVIIAYVFSFLFNFGVNGIWWAYPIANFIGAGIAYFYLKKQDWEKFYLV
jgi:putative MATE family efflux protein